MPKDVAVDVSGNVYVADWGNHRTQKFTSEGMFITKWGSPDGQFDRPSGTVVDTSGNVYVADGQNHRVLKLRRSFRTRAIEGTAESPTIPWDSEPGKTYTVWVSADMLRWVSVPGTIAGSDTGVNSWTDDGSHPLGPPAAGHARFYRIELLP